MTRYGYSIYGQSLYGGPLLSVFSADPVVATPVDYGQVLVTWRAPGGGWDQLKVVRNYLGYPVSVDNGDTVFTTTPAESGTQVTEQDLKQDHWVYYTVFVHDMIDNEWVRAGLARCFVPSDYGGTERMLELAPQVGQSDTLTKFMGVFGYAYDLLRNDINSLLDLHDSMAVSYDLIPLALAQFGIPVEPELEPEQSRRFLRNASFLYKIKGTEPGIHGVVASVTGWQCDVSIGQNLLWTSDYSDFLGSVAGWQALVNASVSWAAPTGPDSGSLQMTATVTGAVSSAGITEHIPMTATEITEGQSMLSRDDTSFETTIGTWVMTLNGTAARSTALAYDGAASLAMTSSVAGDMRARTSALTPANRVTPGVVYTGEVAFRAATTPRDVGVRLVWADALGNTLTFNDGITAADSATGWTTANVTAQAPAGAVYGWIAATVYASAGGEVHYVDQAELVENDGGNLLNGGNFENGTEGWANKANTSLTQSTAQAYTGRASLAMTAVAAGNMSTIVGTPLTPTPGTSYAFSAMVRAATAAKSVQVLIDWYTTANAYISSSVGTTVTDSTTGWTYVSVVGVAPPTAGKMYPYVQVLSAAAGGVHYVDATYLEVGTTPTAWVPSSYSNLVLNPSFETGLANWSTTGAAAPAMSHSIRHAWVGEYSARLAWVTGSTNGTAGFETQGTFVMPGQAYTLSAYVYVPGGSTAVELSVYGTPFPGGIHSATSSVNDQWQRLTVTFTPTTYGWVTLQVEPGNGLTTAAGSVCYVDAVQLELGTVANPYIDGDQGRDYTRDVANNLITNPDFETDTSGWRGFNQNLLTANDSSLETNVGNWIAHANCTVARSTVQSIDGAASLAMTSTAAADIYARTTNTVVPVVAGRVYTAVASFKAAVTSRNVGLQFWFLAADGSTFLSTPSGAVVADNAVGWTQATLTAQAPANAAYAVLLTLVQAVGVVGEVHYVDRIGLFPDPTGNLISTPDFENGTSGWTTFNATLTADTGQAYTGRASAKMVATGVNAGFSQSINATPGAALTFSAYGIQPAGGTSWTLRVFNDTGGAQVGATVPFAATASWTRASTTITVPASGSVSVQITTTGSTGTIYVDAVKVEIGSTATAYVPPITANLVTNPSLEGGVITGWSNAQGFAASTDQAFVGAYSLKTTQTSTTDTNIAMFVVSGLVAGTYTASVYAYVIPGWSLGNIQMAPEATGTTVVTTVSNAGVVGTWVRLVTTFTVAGVAVGASIPIVVRYGAPPGVATNGVIYFDAAQVERGLVANSYVDGSQGSAYTWDASDNLLSAAAASFEDGTVGGWLAGGTGSTVANSAVRAQVGTKSLLVTLGAGAQGGFGTNLALTLLPNTTYTYSVYVYLPSGSVASIEVAALGAVVGGSVINTPVTTTNAWVRHIVTFTTTSAGGAVGLYVLNGATSTAGQTFYVDAVQLEQRSYATPYGNTVPTANNATSTRRQPWCLGGTSLEGISSQVGAAAVGTRHLTISNPTTDVRLNGYVGAVTTVNVAPNTTYTLSMYLQGADFSATVRTVDRSNNIVLGAVSTVYGPLASTRFAVTFMTGSTTTSIDVQVLWTTSYSPFSPRELMYVDAVQLEQRNYVTPYGETGSPGSSTSTRRIASRQETFSGSALVRGLDLSSATASLRFDWYDVNHVLLGSTDSPAVATRQGVDTVVRAANVIPLDNAVEFSPALVVHNPTAGQRWQWRRVMVNRGEPAPYEPGRDIRVALDITDTDQFRRAIHLDRLGKILPRYLPLGATFTLLDATLV